MFDIWDLFGFAGLTAILGGVAAIYWPAALILGGGLLLGAYCFREFRHVPRPPAGILTPHEPHEPGE